MKKILIALIVICSLLSTTSFAYTEKILHGSHGEIYTTVNQDYYTIEFEDYDMPKVTCVSTGKHYIFKLCKDAYYIEGTYRFDKSILDKLNKQSTTSICKNITVS